MNPYRVQLPRTNAPNLAMRTPQLHTPTEPFAHTPPSFPKNRPATVLYCYPPAMSPAIC